MLELNYEWYSLSSSVRGYNYFFFFFLLQQKSCHLKLNFLSCEIRIRDSSHLDGDCLTVLSFVG